MSKNYSPNHAWPAPEISPAIVTREQLLKLETLLTLQNLRKDLELEAATYSRHNGPHFEDAIERCEQAQQAITDIIALVQHHEAKH